MPGKFEFFPVLRNGTTLSFIKALLLFISNPYILLYKRQWKKLKIKNKEKGKV